MITTFAVLASDEPAPTKLPLSLIGTIIRADRKTSLSSVRMTDTKATGEYRVDQRIGSRAVVTAIERERLTLKNLATGKLEYVPLAGYDSSKAVSHAAMEAPGREKEFQIRRSKVDQVLSNLNDFLTKARAVPALGPDGKVRGFRLDWIEAGSLYSELGLKEGDVLRSVNGVELTSIAAAVQVFEQFRNSSMIRLNTERGGKSLDLTYLVRE